MVDKLLFKLAGIRQIMVKLAGLSFLQALLIIGQALFLSATLTDLWLGKPLKESSIQYWCFFGLFYPASRNRSDRCQIIR